MYSNEITFSTEERDSNFQMETQDFIFHLREYLHELNNPQHPFPNALRENLIEYYYTYCFLAREYDWVIPYEIKEMQPAIMAHIKDMVQEQT